MDSSCIVASIGCALHDLDFMLNKLSHSGRITREHVNFIFYLNGLKIFVLISARNLNNQLDDTNLPSVLLRIEDTVHKLSEQFHPEGELIELDVSVADELLRDIESIHDETDEWYFTMRDLVLLQFGDSLFTIDDISKIITSILDVLREYRNEEEIHDILGMEALVDQVKLLQTLICFVEKPTQQLLAHANNVAIRTHLHFMCPRALHGLVEESLDEERLDELLFTWVQTIKPINPQVSEIYTEALRSSMLSRQSPALADQHIDDGAFIATKNFLDCLIDHLWELLRLNNTDCLISVKDQMQELYRKFRSLRTILKQLLPDSIKADIVSLLHDAGVLIFSLYHPHTEVDLECFHDLLKTFKTTLLQLGEEDPPVPDFNFPKTNQLGYVDFVLEKLADLRCREAEPTANSKYVQTIHEELFYLRSFLGDIVEFYQENEEVQALWNLVLEVVYKVECLIDHLLVSDLPISSSTLVDAIMEDIRDIKPKIKVTIPGIEGKRQQKRPKVATMTYNRLPSRTTKNEVVGFADAAKLIKDRLTNRLKKLKVIAIVGMPGVGKTTLATKVYNDISICYHFQVRAWCPISQELDKKRVLFQLLKQVDPNCGCSELNEQDLVQRLWRSLKGKRYLILLDDIWDIEAWNSLAPAFPPDNYGSRIILTSRHQGIAPKHMLDQEPHFLQPLNEKESLELFQKKLLPGNGGFLDPALHDLVLQFVAYCKGLPLTIILVAGIVGTTKPEDWVKILKDLSSGDASVTEHCMQSLELSYKHLPDHLKPCLLYFGAFSEDVEIPTERLLYLWMAEGFVGKGEGKRKKDVAEDYLNDLIGRSLIVVAKKRWNGGVKTCRIHDLLRDYILQKAKDDHFLHLVKGYGELSAFNELCNLRRLCIHSEVEHFKQSKLFCPRARSMLFNDPRRTLHCPEAIKDASFVISIFKLLRVLDLEKINLRCEFPSEISLLVQLAFLAIRGRFRCIPSSIAKLSNLETLIVNPHRNLISLPDSLWNLQKLKYLCITESFGIVPIENIDISPILSELDVFFGAAIPRDCSLERAMTKFPNIRKLKCLIGYDEDEESKYPHTDIVPHFLRQLESLFLLGTSHKVVKFSFLENMKELKLGPCIVSWEDMSTIGKLPNLQVLTLSDTELEGKTWEMKEGEFTQLRVLKLGRVKLVRWIAGDDQFECLQKLVLRDCFDLEEMPSNCLENVPTLETIEVTYCSKITKKLVKQIEQRQIELWGNSDLIVKQVGFDFFGTSLLI